MKKQKSFLLIFLSSIFILSCQESENKTKEYEIPKVERFVTDTIEDIKIVKSIKEVNETSTGYEYKYDWLNGKFRQQPTVNSEMRYYIVFTNGQIEETTKNKGMFYSQGDTVKTYRYVYSN